MKNMSNILLNRFLYLIIFVIFPNRYIYANKSASDKSKEFNVESSYHKLNPDSIILDGYIDIEYNLEGAPQILSIRSIFNNTSAVFRFQTRDQYFNKKYSQVILNKQTAECLRILLYTLYTNHNYLIKDEYRKNYFSCDSYMCTIKMNINGKKINETRNLMHYIFIDDPYNFPFDKIIQLILAITNKIERDILNPGNIKPEAAEWINEMFHDKFYEPYDGVNCKNNNL